MSKYHVSVPSFFKRAYRPSLVCFLLRQTALDQRLCLRLPILLHIVACGVHVEHGGWHRGGGL